MIYHECKSSHSGGCPGCTTDSAKHGKEVIGTLGSITDAIVAIGEARLDWAGNDKVYSQLGKALAMLNKANTIAVKATDKVLN